MGKVYQLQHAIEAQNADVCLSEPLSMPKPTKVTDASSAQSVRSKPLLSPLRYPGGKRRLVAFITSALRLNGLHPSLFVEPFAGGASVALQLLSDGVVDKIGLVDKDPLVAAFWSTVFHDADWLISQIEVMDVSLARWIEYKESEPQTRRDRALTCLFLNRTSFSGILAPGAGPIGGYKQTSAYAIDCRFPKETLIKRVQQIHALRDRVSFVWNLSWASALSRLQRMQRYSVSPHDIFLYCDPPFFYCDPPFFDDAHRLYTHFFRQSDHLHLRDALLTTTYPWILSYDFVEQVQRLYGEEGCSPVHVELLYSAGKNVGNRVTKEMIVSNLDHLPSNLALWKKGNGTKKKSPGVSKSA